MNANDMFGNARFVTPGEKVDTPFIRGEFSLDKPVSDAQITICGLGFYELFINGKRIGDDLYGTLASDFHAYDDQHCYKKYGEITSHRTYVGKLNITQALDTQNCIGVALAPGWYRNGHQQWHVTNYGPVKLCFRIAVTYADGSQSEILSGDWLKWTQSPIETLAFYYGEHQNYDKYRLDGWHTVGYAMADWGSLTEIEAPDTSYEFSDCPPDKIIRYIEPVLLSETDEGFIYDMGENITGTPILASRIDGVQKLELWVSERLNPDGTIEDYTHHNQYSSFVTDGSDRTYRLRFSWNGFRYACVSKNAKIVSCAVIHADIPVTSSFKSDSGLLNWLNETFIRTQLDNMHCGIPSDCPHLEKRGYTGDGELICECAMMMLDAKAFYKKWIGDIFDCQDTVSGHVQYTAPYICSGGGPGGWGCAIAEVPYMYYKTYGDTDFLKEAYSRTLHYFDYLEAHSEEGLVVSDQKDEWCLGDWCTPEDIKIPEPFVNTYFYVKTINRLLEFCRVLGKDGEIGRLTELAEAKKAAIRQKYFDAATGDFASNIQGANAFAVDIGLGDDRTLARMVEHYERETWYDTGIFGTDIVTRVLFERGYENLAFRLLTSKGKYSFHHWRSTGCTTLPEYWTYKRSQNHPMFGAVVKYLYSFLLGIQTQGAGYHKVVIEPKFVDGLNWCEGHLTTACGRIAVKYVKNDGKISVTTEIPEGIEAVFRCGSDNYPLKPGKNLLVL